jgi:hypothetical protein
MTSSDTAIHATHTLQASEAAEEAALLSRTLQESVLPPHLPAILVRTAYDRHTYCDFASMIGTSAGRSWKRSSDDP